MIEVSADSFQQWLIGEIQSVLARQSPTPPFILWCDPDREWLELLRVAAQAGGIELWADPDAHELSIRDRFANAPQAQRVIWLPVARGELTWFKVFELEAEEVWERNLLTALRDYGVTIPREHESDLLPILPAHAREWFGKPQCTWQELTPGNAKGALVDDHRMLQVIAGEPGEFGLLREEERFAIFARRSVDDFGFSDPTNMDEESWRVTTTAYMLCTDAAAGNPQTPPNESERIIQSGLPRDRALKLLKAWQANVHYMAAFERLAQQADTTIGLTFWARNLSTPPRAKTSRAVEETLFTQYAEKLERIEDIETLVGMLEKQLQLFKDRESGFWGRLATNKVGWNYLVQLAHAASLLAENAQIEATWQVAIDAVTWYTTRGWKLDEVGETLFSESHDLPASLFPVRLRLRRAYLRATDRIGQAFSELIAHAPGELMKLPSAGEVLLEKLAAKKVPTALLILDACRLDLGERLAALFNHGEPAKRAEVITALAPIPSITPLGMAFALPMKRDQLHVDLTADRKTFRVTADGFDGDLAIAEQRRKWLTKYADAKEFFSIAEVLDSDKLKRTGKLPKLIVVQGAELDHSGHEGQLQLTGANEHIERYDAAIRRLRDAGFMRILMVTDHGFFHWQPESDEIESGKPSGDIQWSSRRAIVGKDLSLYSALHFQIPQSSLEVVVPRSINAFKTYGGVGFFHGGATLQELIIPVLEFNWPPKATKTPVVLKPVETITSEAPRVRIEAGAVGQQTMFGIDSKIIARRVMVKIQDPSTGKLVFRYTDPISIEPGGEAVTVQLVLVDPKPQLPAGSPLIVMVLDSDDEEIVAREEVTLKVDIDEW